MRKLYLVLSLFCLITSCRHKSFDEQLAAAFTTHLKYVVPDVKVDSFKVLWRTPVNAKLMRIIDDTIYVREYNRIKWQLVNARAMNNKDSMAFYYYEIHVLEHNIDSISSSISQADTAQQNGSIVSCAYFLTAQGRHISDSTFLYLDSAQTLKYTWYVDSTIARTSRSHL